MANSSAQVVKHTKDLWLQPRKLRLKPFCLRLGWVSLVNMSPELLKLTWKKYLEGKEKLMICDILHHLANMMETVIANFAAAATASWLVVIFDDVTADRSSKMNTEMYRAKASAHHIWPNVSCKSSPRVSLSKEMKYFSFTKSVTWSQHNRASFVVTKKRIGGRKTHKQGAAAVKT